MKLNSLDNARDAGLRLLKENGVHLPQDASDEVIWQTLANLQLHNELRPC